MPPIRMNTLEQLLNKSLPSLSQVKPAYISGIKVDLAPLSEEEKEIFAQVFAYLLLPPHTSVERELMLDSVDSYVYALRAIKMKMPGTLPTFVGNQGGDNELVVQELRPMWFKTANTALTNWLTTFAVGGTPQDLWSGATPGKGYLLGHNFGLVITHFKELFGPSADVFAHLSEYQISFGANNALFNVSARKIQMSDNRNGVNMIPVQTVIALPQTTLYASIMADVAGVDNLEPGGLVFGLGSDVRLLTGTWS